MSTEKNKAIVLRHLKDVLEQGQVELIESYYAPDGSNPEMDNPEQWRDRVLWFHKTCPGFKITILDIMAEGDKVMVNLHVDLTYSVPPEPLPSFAFPPLGKPVSWQNMDAYRIVDGKIVEHWAEADTIGLLHQLGLVPPPSGH